MKKLFLIPLTIAVLVSCSAVNSKMEKKEKEEVVNQKVEEYSVNLMAENGALVSLKIKGDDAVAMFNDQSVMLKRMVTASGEGFKNEDGSVQVGLKGKEGYIELSGIVYSLMDVNSVVKKEEVKEVIVNNYKDEKGLGYDLLVVRYSNDTAYVRLNGQEGTLKREVSASGEAFVSEDKKIYLGIKGNEAYLEINGTGISFKDTGTKSKDFAKEAAKVSTIVYNFKKENSKILLVMAPEVENGFLRLDGKEYDVFRTKTASGVAYTTKDKRIKVTVKTKNNKPTAYLELEGKKIQEYVDNGTNSLEYGK